MLNIQNLSQNLLGKLSGEKAPLLTEVLLVGAMAWVVAGALVSSPAKPTLPGAVFDMQGEKATVDLSLLTATPLFGEYKKPDEHAPVVVEKVVAPSRLDLKLLGTVVAGGNSAAIIKLASGKHQRVVYVEEQVQPGVMLQSVEADAIVVDNGGKLERISIQKSGAMPGFTPAPSLPRASGVAVKRELSRSNLQRQTRDLPTLLSQARVVPHFENGKSKGFMINDIVPGSLYAEIGLQNGDIISKVNGRMVSSPQQAMTMYNELQNAPTISIELIRAGVPQQVQYVVH